jgi:RNA polymerase sigma factor for flagellar operon FliA
VDRVEQEKWEQFHRDRDDKTRTWLIEHYTPFVGEVLRRMGRGVRAADREDLRGAGYLGLVQAVDQWDPTRMPWERFAKLRIKYAMVDQIREMSWVPKGLRAQAERIDAEEGALAGELGRTPTTEELAERLETDSERLEKALSTIRGTDWRVTSLDYRQETEEAWMESVADPSAVIPEEETLRNERREILSSLLARLPEKERFIITERFLAGRTQASIASELGCHESRVSQIIDAALERLRGLAKQMPLKLPGEGIAA